MAEEDRNVVERFALENALALLVAMLDEKGVLPSREYREALKARGTDLVMNNTLPFSQQVGREMAEIAKRIV